MKKTRLRTKFLLSFVAISVALTGATLYSVHYSAQRQMRDVIGRELQTSVTTFQTFERQRQAMMSQSAMLLANLPNVRALMTTNDPQTVQDASKEVWQQSGSDMLLLADGTGRILGMQTKVPAFDRAAAEGSLRRSLNQKESQTWWFAADQLFEVRIQPIYFGAESRDSGTGFLVLADAIDRQSATEFGAIVSNEVAFYDGDSLVVTTLSGSRRLDLSDAYAKFGSSQDPTPEIRVGNERYIATRVNLGGPSSSPVTLVILKSLDEATAFITTLNRVLLILGLLSIALGTSSVFFLSNTFTQPLGNLVKGVRALSAGDFGYPLDRHGDDEVAEVTIAFDQMRTNLQKTQSEQKTLEERLRQAHKMEAVGRLAGGVAHDFNNLLTIIRGHGDILLSRIGAADANRHNIEQVQKAADRAVSMTRQLLAFSRMQVLQPRVLDLNRVVGDLGKMLPRLIGEHIEYTFTPGEKLGTVMADPGQIEQVIMNLVVNARDAMAEGGKISLRTANVSLDEAEAAKRPPMMPGAYALLSVTDTGHGMDADTKARIFEPFFTTKEVGKGTGLGLATVYGVVKQSGGFIWVESAPAKGATFEIYLPLRHGRVMETENKNSPIPKGKETILVVEDESGVRELACEFLKINGYSVLEAQDGHQALEIAAAHQGEIDVFLSDVVMPKMSGIETAAKLKEIRPQIKILLMSGYSEYTAASANAGSLSQMPPVLQKPFSMISLVSKIREVMGQATAVVDKPVEA